jgi:hypothetical protein
MPTVGLVTPPIRAPEVIMVDPEERRWLRRVIAAALAGVVACPPSYFALLNTDRSLRWWPIVVVAVGVSAAMLTGWRAGGRRGTTSAPVPPSMADLEAISIHEQSSRNTERLRSERLGVPTLEAYAAMQAQLAANTLLIGRHHLTPFRVSFVWVRRVEQPGRERTNKNDEDLSLAVVATAGTVDMLERDFRHDTPAGLCILPVLARGRTVLTSVGTAPGVFPCAERFKTTPASTLIMPMFPTLPNVGEATWVLVVEMWDPLGLNHTDESRLITVAYDSADGFRAMGA